ncbi:hypothetical protein V1264_010676 [Littorina saxatilis]|uniref:Fibrinogen C-terminal domain-containing protein n=1 Tax=Littorina saxatilis TaxID=31220 RepID=A0AAN9AQ23_9CAEN
MSLLIILALGWTVGIVKANSKGYMYANAGLAGKMFTENIVFESAAKNAPHCALVCNHHDSCMSFTFNHNICRGHAVLVTSNTTSVLAAGARSFYTEGKIRSCADRRTIDGQSGVRTLYTSLGSPLLVYCDQNTDNGGWTVFQRRQDGSVDFYRNWTEYQHMFGDLEGNFWLGLDALHMLTSSQSYELRVDLMTFSGTKGYATYSNFTISDSSDNYRLRFETFTGGNASMY